MAVKRNHFACPCFNVSLKMSPIENENRDAGVSFSKEDINSVASIFKIYSADVIAGTLDYKVINQSSLVSCVKVDKMNKWIIFCCDYCELNCFAMHLKHSESWDTLMNGTRVLVNSTLKTGDEMNQFKENRKYSEIFGIVLWKEIDSLISVQEKNECAEQSLAQQAREAIITAKIASESRISQYTRDQVTIFDTFKQNTKKELANLEMIQNKQKQQGKISLATFSQEFEQNHTKNVIMQGVKQFLPLPWTQHQSKEDSNRSVQIPKKLPPTKEPSFANVSSEEFSNDRTASMSMSVPSLKPTSFNQSIHSLLSSDISESSDQTQSLGNSQLWGAQISDTNDNIDFDDDQVFQFEEELQSRNSQPSEVINEKTEGEKDEYEKIPDGSIRKAIQNQTRINNRKQNLKYVGLSTSVPIPIPKFNKDYSSRNRDVNSKKKGENISGKGEEEKEKHVGVKIRKNVHQSKDFMPPHTLTASTYDFFAVHREMQEDDRREKGQTREDGESIRFSRSVVYQSHRKQQYPMSMW